MNACVTTTTTTVNINAYWNAFKNELIYGGHMAAMVAPAFILSVSLMMSMVPDLHLLAIAYLIPLISYSFDYYKEMNKDILTNPERAEYMSRNIKIYPYVIGSYILLLVALLALTMNINMIVFTAALIISGVVYGKFLKGFTRKIVAFKNIYTALMWALLGSIMIPIYYSVNIDTFFMLMLAFVFLKVILNVMFFDLKDLEGDREEGLKTLPVVLGKSGALKFLNGLNLLAFVPLAIGIWMNIVPMYTIMLGALFFYDRYYLKKAAVVDSKELRSLSYVMADAEFLLWPVLLAIGIGLFTII